MVVIKRCQTCSQKVNVLDGSKDTEILIQILSCHNPTFLFLFCRAKFVGTYT